MQKYYEGWMQTRLTMMQMQQNKDMINGVTYSVFMHHVMIYQIMVVYMLMDSDYLIPNLVVMLVHLTEELHVKSLFQVVQTVQQTTLMQMQM